MSLTLAVQDTNANRLDHEGQGAAWVRFTATFDSSYAAGGEALTAATLQTALNSAMSSDVTLSSLDRVIVGTDDSYTIRGNFDATNGKLEAHYCRPGSTLTTVDAEVVGVSSHTGTLTGGANVIAVSAVDITAGGATGTGNKTSVAPATTLDVQVVLSTGVLNFLAADAVTSATVAYVYDAGSEVPGTTDLSTYAVPCMAWVTLS